MSWKDVLVIATDAGVDAPAIALAEVVAQQFDAYLSLPRYPTNPWLMSQPWWPVSGLSCWVGLAPTQRPPAKKCPTSFNH